MTKQCAHENLRQGYYGHDCADCGELIYPYGCEPWALIEDDDSDYPKAGRGDDWEDEDDEDEWLYRCGWVRGEGCTLAGTEEYDWECPFRRDFYRGLALTQARMAKRAAQKGGQA